MADWYVRSTNPTDGDGSNWDNAFQSILSAFSSAVVGDRILVSHQHNEEDTTSTAVVFDLGLISDPPTQILCVRDDVSPLTLADTGVFYKKYIQGTIALRGHLYLNGIRLLAGLPGNNSSISFANTNSDSIIIAENCVISLPTTSASASNLNIGYSGGLDNNFQQILFFRKCAFRIGQSAHRIRLNNGHIKLEDCSMVPGAGYGTEIFNVGTSGKSPNIEISNFDFSTAPQGINLFPASAPSAQQISVVGAIPPPSWTGLIVPTIISPAFRVLTYGVDNAGTNYRFSHHRYTGVVREETTVVRAGGASDGTTALSWRMGSSEWAALVFPLESPPINAWNDGTSAITLTAEIVNDGVTLKNDECWIEVEYLGSAASPKSTIISNRKTNILATAANQPTSAANWTTTGLTAPVKQKLSVTFTPAQKGPWTARVMLARPSTTVYVCPKIEVS
jgi:hypothetical protein